MDCQEDGGDFAKIVDLQDEHGDTALNIAARVGSRTLVRTLVDVGANKMLMNKLGLKPGDFGVESEVRTFITLGLFAHSLQELSGGPKRKTSLRRYDPYLPYQCRNLTMLSRT